MKISDVIKTLMIRLPRNTNLFSTEDDIVGVSYDANTGVISYDTASVHNLQIGSYVNIVGAEYEIPITTLVYDALTGVASAETDFITDLSINTAGERFSHSNNPLNDLNKKVLDGDCFVEIRGADQTEYNGEFILVATPQTTVFHYLITENPPTVSPATGSPVVVLKNNAFNSFFEVVDVLSPTSFVVQIPEPHPAFAPNFGDIKVRSKFRISGAITDLRAIDSYTAQSQNELWAFAIRQDQNGESSFVSQNRHIPVDSIDVVTRGTAYQQKLIERFSILVFVPSTNSIGGRQSIDLIEDVKKFLIESICGVLLPSVFTKPVYSAVTFVGENFADYNTAFYIHRFNFERIVDIIKSDIAPELNTVVLNTIDINYLNEKPIDEVIMTDKIDYEEEV